MLEAGLLTAGTKAFSAALGKLVAEHAVRASIKSVEKLNSLRTDISPHLEATFNRCITIKTLLNPYTPADFLSIYAKQRFSLSSKSFDNFTFVDFIKLTRDNIVITGTGGSGKSMFMKYLWLSLFEDGGGKIPLFVELRNVSSVGVDGIKSYLFHTLTQGRASITQKDFERKLSNGDFFMILDGFDEVANEHKDGVQKAIIDLCDEYPALKIVLSSRPDERFGAWPSFHVASVAPMELADVLELIEKAEFDPVSKDKFYKKVKSGELYAKHGSFLKNPLLASMMLLTFSYNFDIPDKMHLFYGQAFDALYKRHDSHKPGGYKRQFSTKASEDSFKKILAYFCIVSYHKQQYEFSYDEVIDTADSAIKLAQSEVGAQDFYLDLKDCICFIVPEGLKFVFSHRSFQEYFAAYCLKYVSREKFSYFVSAFAQRHNDQTINLISDMNPEYFRDLYIIPMADVFDKKVPPGDKRGAELLLEAWDGSFHVSLRDKTEARPRGIDIGLFHRPGEFRGFIDAIQKVSPNRFRRSGKKAEDPDGQFVDEVIRQLGSGFKGEISITSQEGRFVFSAVGKGSDVVELDFERTESAFRKSNMFAYINDKYKNIRGYISQARESSERAKADMRDIFD